MRHDCIEESKVSSRITSTYAEDQKIKGSSYCFVCQNKESPRRAPEEFHYKEEKDSSIPQQLLR